METWIAGRSRRRNPSNSMYQRAIRSTFGVSRAQWFSECTEISGGQMTTAAPGQM